MINSVELEKLRTPKQLDDKVVRNVLTEKILNICHQIKQPAFLRIFKENHTTLFSLKEGEYSSLVNDKEENLGVVENERLQNLGLEAMRQFGLNDGSLPNITRTNIRGNRIEQMELAIYDSEKIDGLKFERSQLFDRDKKLIEVEWQVWGKV